MDAICNNTAVGTFTIKNAKLTLKVHETIKKGSVIKVDKPPYKYNSRAKFYFAMSKEKVIGFFSIGERGEINIFNHHYKLKDGDKITIHGAIKIPSNHKSYPTHEMVLY